jgi:hypothetical protein
MKDWEVVADNLKKAGWSLGWVSAIDSQGRTIWIVDAHRGDGNDQAKSPNGEMCGTDQPVKQRLTKIYFDTLHILDPNTVIVGYQ